MNPTDPVHDFSQMADNDDFTGSFDARDWARAFIGTLQTHPTMATDEEAMLGWFADALMRGYDTGRNDSSLRMAGRICGEQPQQGQRAMAPPAVSERLAPETVASDPCGILAGDLLNAMLDEVTSPEQLEIMAKSCRAAAEICYSKAPAGVSIGGILSKAFYGSVHSAPIMPTAGESQRSQVTGGCNTHLTPETVDSRKEFG